MSTVETILMRRGPGVIVTARDTTVLEAVRLMCEAKLGAIVAMDEKVVEGIFTERDLMRRVVAVGRDPGETRIEDVMVRGVCSVSVGTDVRECFRIMRAERFRHLAVMESDTLLGMVNLRDVLEAELADEEAKATHIEREPAHT